MKRIVMATALVVVVVLVALGLRARPLAVELAQVSKVTVREYVAEDAKTRLDDEFIIDMPINGTVEPPLVEVGDQVDKNAVLAHVDPYSLEQEIARLEAMIEQSWARIDGVDSTKPKPEAVESAAVKVREQQDAEAIARKELDMARIDQDLARKEYERVNTLNKQGITSQSAYDEALRRYQSSQENLRRAELAQKAAQKALEIARLSSLEVADSVDDNEYMREVFKADIKGLTAQLDALRADLEKAVVRAPVAGYVLEKYVEERRVLMAGAPLLRLGDMGSIEIESDILSEEVCRVRVGNSVEIYGKALQGEVIEGKVKRVYPSGFKKISALGIEQQRVKVIIEFDNTELRLRPGTSVDVRVITEERAEVPAVPERAAFKQDGGWAVFVVRDGRAHLAPVEIGLKNDDWAEILSGVAEGDIIVSEPRNDLEDGMRVTALEER